MALTSRTSLNIPSCSGPQRSQALTLFHTVPCHRPQASGRKPSGPCCLRRAGGGRPGGGQAWHPPCAWKRRASPCTYQAGPQPPPPCGERGLATPGQPWPLPARTRPGREPIKKGLPHPLAEPGAERQVLLTVPALPFICPHGAPRGVPGKQHKLVCRPESVSR